MHRFLEHSLIPWLLTSVELLPAEIVAIFRFLAGLGAGRTRGHAWQFAITGSFDRAVRIGVARRVRPREVGLYGA